MPRFIVMTAAAKMPSSCAWGPYRRVALVEVEDGFEGVPRMISDRARGVIRVVETWERLSAKGGGGTAFARAVQEAQAKADALNAGSAS